MNCPQSIEKFPRRFGMSGTIMATVSPWRSEVASEQRGPLVGFSHASLQIQEVQRDNDVHLGYFNPNLE